jgi:predicted amino acid dehydrogenase
VEKFAFIIHPLDVHDITRRYPIAAKLPERLVEWVAKKCMSPRVVSHITGLRSRTGAEAEGWFVACPLTARCMKEDRESEVLAKIIEAGRVAERTGARIVGLGAFTSVVGDAGITVARNLNIAVTTGNSYTVATALEGTRRAAEIMGTDLAQAQAAVLGATGSIGRVCVQVLAQEVREVCLIGRDLASLEALAESLRPTSRAALSVSADVHQALPQADVVVCVTSAATTVVEPEDLKPGAVVCDVARPRDVSRRVVEKRNDVLVIEGGVVEPPGPVDFGFDFGFPPGTGYACMAETMILALERRYENFSLGRDLELAKVQEIHQLADKHGFRLAGFRSFERAVTDEEIARIRANAERRKALQHP